jgi:hypothetical protein
MTTTKTTHHSLASLKLPRTVPALITYAKSIVVSMTGNPSFPTPIPTLAAVTAAIDQLQVAETAALARTKGAVTVRNEKRTALVALLKQLLAYVQAAADANVENGVSIIESAGVAVKKTPAHRPRVFDARPGAVSGSVKLLAKSVARRASYDWEYSIDGGKTWVTLPSTLQTKTSVTGLASGSTVQFRYRALTKTGEGDWSQPVALLIQ